jgi:hypothetical protein
VHLTATAVLSAQVSTVAAAQCHTPAPELDHFPLLLHAGGRPAGQASILVSSQEVCSVVDGQNLQGYLATFRDPDPESVPCLQRYQVAAGVSSLKEVPLSTIHAIHLDNNG